MTRAYRIARARFVMNLTEAATALCVEPRIISKAVRDNRLAAQREELDGGRFRYRILRSDLERFLAGELEEKGATAEDDARVERIRAAEFEGKAGKW